MNIERIITNLERAIQVIKATPEEQVDLNTFQCETECGTLHCTAGHLAMDPFFQAQGLVLTPLPHGRATLTRQNGGYDWLDELFGSFAFDAVFDSYAAGTHDRLWLEEYIEELEEREDNDDPEPEKPITDKELALLRLRDQLQAYLTWQSLPEGAKL